MSRNLAVDSVLGCEAANLFQKFYSGCKGAFWTKEWKVAFLLSSALVLFENIVFKVYARYAETLLTFNSYMALAVAFGIAVSFVWLFIFIGASFCAQKFYRVIYFTLFALVILFQYSYQMAVGHFVTLEEFVLAIWQTDVSLKLAMSRSYFNLLAFIPISAYAGCLILTKAKAKTGWKTLLAVLLTAFGMYSGLVLSTQANFSTTSLNAFALTLASLAWNSSSVYNGPREDIPNRAVSRPHNNVILVIDESIKAEHLSLNGYERSTTPYLEELSRAGYLTNWGIAVAGANSSVSSNILLWTGFPTAKLPDLDNATRKMPTIFQYARAMGYTTHYFDSQLTTRWIGTDYDSNFIDDIRLADRFQTQSEFDADFALAHAIVDVIDGSVGNFIVANKKGAHFPYINKFPKQDIVWRPSQMAYMPQPQVPRAELINAYDNAIRYNLEGFFRSLDLTHRKWETALIYTSDHGQNLCEHGEPASHASEYSNGRDKLKTEVTVPLFMLSSRREHWETKEQFNKAAHNNIFATILDLMGFPQSGRPHQYGQSLLSSEPFKSGPRYFFAGYKLNRRLITEGVLSFEEP
jgi:glucan phosphoethanolaminetransferase (alkaline phosphatase superfamily)